MTNKKIIGNIALPNAILKGEIEFNTHIVNIKSRPIPPDAPYVFPGFIDIHTHGCNGYGIIDGQAESVLHVAEGKAKQGVTSFLPTTLSTSNERLVQSLDSIKTARNIQNDSPQNMQADIAGIHLEGPYITKSRYRGAQNPLYIRDPDPIEFDELEKASGNLIKQVTLAPELPNALEFIEILNHKGIRVSAGHSQANACQFQKAIKAGIASGTHLFNGMKEFSHYDLGVAGSLLVEDDLYCEIIVDGNHIVFDALDIVFRCKPRGRIMAVSDSSYCSGMADGQYDFEGIGINIQQGVARTHEGGLAGSLVKMNEMLKNLIEHFLDRSSLKSQLSLPEIGRMLAQNQAEYLGLEKIGKIAEGYESNFAIFDNTFNLMQTIKRGMSIFNNDNFAGLNGQ